MAIWSSLNGFGKKTSVDRIFPKWGVVGLRGSQLIAQRRPARSIVPRGRCDEPFGQALDRIALSRQRPKPGDVVENDVLRARPRKQGPVVSDARPFRGVGDRLARSQPRRIDPIGGKPRGRGGQDRLERLGPIGRDTLVLPCPGDLATNDVVEKVEVRATELFVRLEIDPGVHVARPDPNRAVVLEFEFHDPLDQRPLDSAALVVPSHRADAPHGFDSAVRATEFELLLELIQLGVDRDRASPNALVLGPERPGFLDPSFEFGGGMRAIGKPELEIEARRQPCVFGPLGNGLEILRDGGLGGQQSVALRGADGFETLGNDDGTRSRIGMDDQPGRQRLRGVGRLAPGKPFDAEPYRTILVAAFVPDARHVAGLGSRESQHGSVRQPIIGQSERDALVELDDLFHIVEQADKLFGHCVQSTCQSVVSRSTGQKEPRMAPQGKSARFCRVLDEPIRAAPSRKT